MTGRLVGDFVVIDDPKEGNQIYNKGNYGYPRSGGGLDLDLTEATYLSECRRIEVVDENGPVSFHDLFIHAARLINGFDIRYMVYQDLRSRGFVVKIETGDYDMSVFPRGKTMSNSRPQYYVRAISERNAVDVSEFVKEAYDAERHKKNLLYGIVDEEGDLTYYTLSMKDPYGEVFSERTDRKPVGVLVSDRVFVMDPEDAESIMRSGFFGKRVGDMLQLSLIESSYLLVKGRMSVVDNERSEIDYDRLTEIGESMQDEFELRDEVFSDLRDRGLVVKAGFKYGTHFRVYNGSPDDSHAKYLVHAVSDKDIRMWPEISRTVRLSGGVKKDILFGRVHKGRVQYLEFKWYRP
ncbi:MAG: tRNA-intron lyase [Candidatus Methanomethylophilaceae archaeon]|nr:tRNA-intron lyase [Candidatus Methanomethylophilaceae archaeon]